MTVAMVRLAPDSPRLLLAEHLTQGPSILIFRVPGLGPAERTISEQGARWAAG